MLFGLILAISVPAMAQDVEPALPPMEENPECKQCPGPGANGSGAYLGGGGVQVNTPNSQITITPGQPPIFECVPEVGDPCDDL
jgi:hypothetical protein